MVVLVHMHGITVHQTRAHRLANKQPEFSRAGELFEVRASPEAAASAVLCAADLDTAIVPAWTAAGCLTKERQLDPELLTAG